MDLKTFLEQLDGTQCPRWDGRQKRLHALDLIRRGEHYEALPALKDFDDAHGKGKFGKGDEYVEIKDRRPAIEFDLPAIIVRDAISMTFSESKFPSIVFEAPTDTDAVNTIITGSGLRARMPEIGHRSSIGSLVVVLDVFEKEPEDDGGTLWFDYWGSWECIPKFSRKKPWKLDEVTRIWDVTRSALVLDGYDVEALEARWKKYELDKGFMDATTYNLGQKRQYDDWYMRRTLDSSDSTWFDPVPKHIYERAKWDEWTVDADRTDHHALGFCPAVWATPGGGTWPDGECLFKGAIKNSFMIDRVFSVGGQAIISAGMPILAMAKPSSGNTFGAEVDGGSTMGNSSGGADITPDSIIETEEVNGAWLVQMKADAIEALDKWARLVRSITIENCGGSRISEDSLSGAKSGYALELLNQALIWVVDQLRLSLGSGTLIQLIMLIDRINKKIPIANMSNAKISDGGKLKEISWPPYYEPFGADKLAEVQGVTAALEAALISQETAVTNVAPMFDVVDVQTEMKTAQNEKQEQQKQEQANAVELIKAKPAPATSGPPK